MVKARKTSRSEQGQSLVEFALGFIIMLLLLAAVADFGRAFYTYLALRDAAQEGAIYATLCPTDLAGIESRARNASRYPIDLTAANIEIDCAFQVSGNPVCGSVAATPGSGVKVDAVFHDFTLTTPLLGSILGGQTIDIRATIQDTILRGTCPNQINIIG